MKSLGMVEVYSFTTALCAADAAAKAADVKVIAFDRNRPIRDDAPAPLVMILKIEGDVADVCEVEISYSDTSKTLREKISEASAKVLEKNLPLLENGELKFLPQDSSKATYARKLSKQDMYLDFRKSAEELRNRIRAFGAGIFIYENEAIKIFDVDVVRNEEMFSDCGKILEASSNGLVIACSHGAILAKKLQRPCCKVMNDKDFFAGFKMNKDFIITSENNVSLLRNT